VLREPVANPPETKCSEETSEDDEDRGLKTLEIPVATGRLIDDNLVKGSSNLRRALVESAIA
jgi:hypothetical protein